MKNTFKTSTLTTILAILFFSACQPSRQLTAARTPKAVFIIADGIPGDVIERLKPPVLMEIAGKQGFTRAFTGGEKGTWSQSPTISAVGYNNLITGTWAAKHNVWNNSITAPNHRYQSLFRLVKSANPSLTTAIYSTWLDNRTKLAGEGLPETGDLVIDFELDGLENDTVRFPHDKGRKFMQRIDSAVTTAAAKTILEKGPDLTWIYTEFTDDMGHMYGDSPAFHDAILGTDRQIGKVWEAIQRRTVEKKEDWLLIITTDHGRDSITGKHHGRQSNRERDTWMVTNAKGLNERFRSTPAVVDIYPTIAHHLGIRIPEDVANELDGVPLTGPINVSEFSALRQGERIRLSWKPLVSKGNGKILMATTDFFKTGGKDQYMTITEVPLSPGTFEFEPTVKSEFYKFILVTPEQRVNGRIISETGKKQ